MQRQDLRDLVRNESFINYCFGVNQADMRYWEKWLLENPQEELEIAELKRAVLMLGCQIGNSEAQAGFDALNVRLSAKTIPEVRSKNSIKIWLRYSAAAVVIIAFGIAFYTFKQNSRLPETTKMQDVKPGANKAVLTLGDGTKVSLTDAVDGVVANQAGTKILKTAAGQLRYDCSKAGVKDANSYNTIEVPAGGQWQVILPDHSKVWLNSKSTITYPSRFTGTERRVKISGEVYFEVSPDKVRPFKVEVRNQVVEVVGTHFNITAYEDEKLVKTTLIEGLIKVSEGKVTKLLTPGQQAEVGQGKITVSRDVDLEDVVAWKNGYFKFDENLKTIMAKVAKWYDVEVLYQFEPDPNIIYAGKVSRSKNISSLLKIIEFNGDVHFKIEGRRVVVTR